MATANEIEAFLQDFKVKFNVWGIVFIRPERNTQTLLLLEISPNEREKIVSQITVSDYSKGPTKDVLNGGPDLWVFKKNSKGTSGLYKSNTWFHQQQGNLYFVPYLITWLLKKEGFYDEKPIYKWRNATKERAKKSHVQKRNIHVFFSLLCL